MKTKIIYTVTMAFISIIGFAYSYNILNLSNCMYEFIKEIIFKFMAFGGFSALIIVDTYWIIKGLKENKEKKDLIRRFEIFQKNNDGLFIGENAMVDTELKNQFTFKELIKLKNLKYIKFKNIDFETL